MVILFEQQIRNDDRHSSKGNQLKWENKGTWYKADYAGYEGLAEYMVSEALRRSTLSPQEYVSYQPEQIQYKTVRYQGVKSRNFLQRGWQIITLERLYHNYNGVSLTEAVWHIADVKDRFFFLVSETERITGLKQFGVYLNKLFTIDAVFLNEDRHLHNIAVLMNEQGEFRYCPIFDHGGSLLSDITMDYPMDLDVYTLIGEVRAKTISSSLDEQLEVSEEIAGKNLHFCLRRKELPELLREAGNYPDQQKRRVEDILLWQMKRYGYLFR